jgi:hypothetical protein
MDHFCYLGRCDEDRYEKVAHRRRVSRRIRQSSWLTRTHNGFEWDFALRDVFDSYQSNALLGHYPSTAEAVTSSRTFYYGVCTDALCQVIVTDHHKLLVESASRLL